MTEKYIYTNVQKEKLSNIFYGNSTIKTIKDKTVTKFYLMFL